MEYEVSTTILEFSEYKNIDFNKLSIELEKWIQKYFHFNGLKFDYNLFSAYDFVENIIYISQMNTPETNKKFRQFLYEYGASAAATDFMDDSLIFLHELSHCLTNSLYDDFELTVYNFQKEDVDSFTYWEVRDEFEANMVVVDFINNNPEAIYELDKIFWEWW